MVHKRANRLNSSLLVELEHRERPCCAPVAVASATPRRSSKRKLRLAPVSHAHPTSRQYHFEKICAQITAGEINQN